MSDLGERMRADHLAVLVDALDSVDLSPYEHKMLRWLAGLDRSTVEPFAEMFRKTRGAGRTGCAPGRERQLIARLRGLLTEVEAERDQLVRTRLHLEARCKLLEARCEELTAALRGEGPE